MNLITPSFGLFFWQSIIFILMLFILGKFTWKPIINFIEIREKYIKDSLKKTKEIRNELYNLQFYKEHWIKESNLQRDILLSETKNISNFIRLDSLQESKKDKIKMLKQASFLLKKEKEEVNFYIKNYIAHLAIDIAENLLEKELKKREKQEYIISNLIDNFLVEL